MKRLLPFLFVAACGPTKPAEPTTSAATEAHDRVDPLADAQTKVRAALNAKGAKINERIEPGPLGTQVVRAMIEGASPGTGVAAAFVTSDGNVVGPKDPAAFAEYARKSDWLAHPPAADVLVWLANIALFDGMIARDDTPPKITSGPDALTIEVISIAYPSGAKDRVTIVVTKSGPAAIDIAAADPKPVETDPVAALQAALKANDAAAISAGIAKLQRTTDPAGLAALAAVTLLPNETLATNAMMAMGANPESAKALKQAWSTLSPEARDKLIAVANELYPPDFVNLLK